MPIDSQVAGAQTLMQDTLNGNLGNQRDAMGLSLVRRRHGMWDDNPRSFEIVFSITGWWFGTSILFSHILGMSSSQLTFIFFRGVAQPPTRLDLHLKLELHFQEEGNW